VHRTADVLVWPDLQGKGPFFEGLPIAPDTPSAPNAATRTEPTISFRTLHDVTP
jgi:hypothetical protein